MYLREEDVFTIRLPYANRKSISSEPSISLCRNYGFRVYYKRYEDESSDGKKHKSYIGEYNDHGDKAEDIGRIFVTSNMQITVDELYLFSNTKYKYNKNHTTTTTLDISLKYSESESAFNIDLIIPNKGGVVFTSTYSKSRVVEDLNVNGYIIELNRSYYLRDFINSYFNIKKFIQSNNINYRNKISARLFTMDIINKRRVEIPTYLVEKKSMIIPEIKLGEKKVPLKKLFLNPSINDHRPGPIIYLQLVIHKANKKPNFEEDTNTIYVPIVQYVDHTDS